MKLRLLLFSFLVLGLVQTVSAQMAQFKALYIYNFAKNVGWPEGDNSKDFVITVIGDNEMAVELENLTKTRKIGARSVVVKKAPMVSDASASQIIFLGSSKSSQITALATSFGTSKTLLVSDKQGHCSSGAAICFMPVDGKLQYEISARNIKKAGLSIAAKIISLGIDAD